jgi:hypothetical protein
VPRPNIVELLSIVVGSTHWAIRIPFFGFPPFRQTVDMEGVPA